MLARPLLGFLTISVAVEMKIILIIIIFTKKMSSALLQFNAHPWLPDIYIYIYIYKYISTGSSCRSETVPCFNRVIIDVELLEETTNYQLYSFLLLFLLLLFLCPIGSIDLCSRPLLLPPPTTHHPPPRAAVFTSVFEVIIIQNKKKYLHERDQRRKRQFVRRFRVIEFCEPAQLTPDPMYCCVVEAIIFCLLVSVSINNKNAVSYTNLPPCPPLSSAKKKTFGPIFERKIN